MFPTVPLCYSCYNVIWPKPVGPLWACCLFFSQWLNIVIWAFWLHYLQAPMSHFPFGHPWPIYFPWASLALSSLVFLWAFTNSLRLLWSNYFILHPWGSWTFYQPLTFFTFITSGMQWHILTFLHHILPMDLLLLSFRAPLGPVASSRPICLFHGSAIHYSCHLGLMVFLFIY